MAILVIDDREVQNRILHTERPFGRSELEQAANYLNHLFAGKDITDVRRVLIREMRDTRENMNRLMATAYWLHRQRCFPLNNWLIHH